MDRFSGSTQTHAAPVRDEATERVLLRECGLLQPVADGEIDRWMAALVRTTGAAVAATCLLDDRGAVLKSVWTTTGAADRTAVLEDRKAFAGRLRRLAGEADDGSCAFVEHPVQVCGRVIGYLGIADRRSAWSSPDLASLDDASEAVASYIRARLATAEVSRVQDLVASHNRVHGMIARGVPLRAVLVAVCEAIERHDPSLMPSVLLRDTTSNTLHGGVGPAFPQEYFDAVEGAPVGPSIGTCGPAAWFGRLTVSENLAEDPNWAPIRGLSQMVGVAHCWSMPIKDSDDVVVGTLALYGRSPRAPQPEHLALLEDWARVAGTAIERARSLDRLTYDARHDALTGLPNRAATLERLEQAVRRISPDLATAVLFIDLDGLKAMNDTLGHDVADQMLQTMAQRLSQRVRDSDFVGRLGGDEFIVVAEGIHAAEEAGLLGARLLEAVAQPLTGLTSMRVTASIGIAVVRSNDIDAREALHKADEAMYAAKAAGKDCCVFAEIGETVRAGRRFQLARALHGAETRGEMHLVYQPIVGVPGREIVGVEALLHWTSPEFGEVDPAEFLPLAEDTDNILQLGAWVLRESCEALAGIVATGRSLELTVNVSARQTSNPDFPMWVKQTLAHAELPADRLILEMTEDSFTRADEVTVQNLRVLAASGVRIALDGVRAGQMSLGWLQHDLVHLVKLDRSLVGVTDNDREHTIAAGVIGIARSVGCRVTGEGVETGDDLRRLEQMQCDAAQGPYLVQPVPADQLRALPARIVTMVD